METNTPRKEIDSRTAAFQEALSGTGIDVAIIVQSADLFYFSGTVQRGYLIIPSKGEPVFAATGDPERIRQESPLSKIDPIRGIEDLVSIIAALVNGLEGAVIGVEEDVIPAALYKKMAFLFEGAHLKDVSTLIRALRMIKSPYEVELIRESATIYPEVISQLERVLRPGMSEIALESELVLLGRKRSHFGYVRVRAFNQEMYYGHVISGPRAAAPSYLMSPTGGMGPCPAFGQGASFHPIEPDTPIIIDLCFGISGYLSDQTRTAVMGSLPPEMEKAYKLLLDLKVEVGEMLRPGAIPSEVYAKALQIAERLGISDNFMGFGPRKAKFIGHGIGLEIDEWPVIGKGFTTPLEPGMVLALEPKLTFPGLGVVGLEDNYLIGENGAEKLNQLAEDIIYIPQQSH